MRLTKQQLADIREGHDYDRRFNVGKKSSKTLQAAHFNRGELLDHIAALEAAAGDLLRIGSGGSRDPLVIKHNAAIDALLGES